MDYKLAKRLKDAGYPQKHLSGDHILQTEPNTSVSFRTKNGEEVSFGAYDHNADSAYVPTLSELIEACGERFDCLDKMNKTTWYARAYVPDGYLAVPNGLETYKEMLNVSMYSGSTPEEAVALLWLSLHKHG